MSDIIILPGIGGSGPEHWQTRWERGDPSMRRFAPSDWDRPRLDDWLDALERAAAGAARPALLVAHSLACLLVAHWAARSRVPVRGALLVAVPDADGAGFPAEASSFAAVPTQPLPFPALIVASTDDPYGTPDHARTRARQWGTGLVLLGALGHINAASGLGDWPEGRALLTAFDAGTRRPG